MNGYDYLLQFLFNSNGKGNFTTWPEPAKQPSTKDIKQQSMDYAGYVVSA